MGIRFNNKILLKTSWYIGIIALVGGWLIFFIWLGARHIDAQDFEFLEGVGLIWVIVFFWLCLIAFLSLLVSILINSKNLQSKMLFTLLIILINIPSVLIIFELQKDIDQKKIFLKIINKTGQQIIDCKLQGRSEIWRIGSIDEGSSKVFNYTPAYLNFGGRLYQKPDTLSLIITHNARTYTIEFQTLKIGSCKHLTLNKDLKIENQEVNFSFDHIEL